MNRINQQALKLATSLSETVQNKANRIYALYENYFGIAELKNIQLSVLKVRSRCSASGAVDGHLSKTTDQRLLNEFIKSIGLPIKLGRKSVHRRIESQTRGTGMHHKATGGVEKIATEARLYESCR